MAFLSIRSGRTLWHSTLYRCRLINLSIVCPHPDNDRHASSDDEHKPSQKPKKGRIQKSFSHVSTIAQHHGNPSTAIQSCGLPVDKYVDNMVITCSKHPLRNLVPKWMINLTASPSTLSLFFYAERSLKQIARQMPYRPPCP